MQISNSLFWSPALEQNSWKNTFHNLATSINYWPVTKATYYTLDIQNGSIKDTYCSNRASWGDLGKTILKIISLCIGLPVLLNVFVRQSRKDLFTLPKSIVTSPPPPPPNPLVGKTEPFIWSPANSAELPTFEFICNHLKTEKREVNKDLVENSTKMLALLNADFYQDINTNAESLTPYEGKPIPLKAPVFVHMAPIKFAQDIIINGFKGCNDSHVDCISTSLFSPEEDKPGLYSEKGRDSKSIGIILSVPPEAIVQAHRTDVFSPRAGENQAGYAAFCYQFKVIHAYISRVHDMSSMPKEKVRKRINSDPNYHTSKKHLEKLFCYYQDTIIENEEIEFERIFGYKMAGRSIKEELQFIQKAFSNIWHHKPLALHQEKLGKQQTVKQLTDITRKRSDFNEVFILSPSKCNALGVNSPQIKGILIHNKTNEMPTSLMKTIKCTKLPLYCVENSPFNRSHTWEVKPKNPLTVSS